MKPCANPKRLFIFRAMIGCLTMAGLLAGLDAVTHQAQAAEGMYLLDKLPVAKLKRSKLKIPPAKLQELSRAVVRVASGGTGSFVSDRGLVVTNHHVAYDCLATLGSQKDHLGLLDKGYLARSRQQELPCPGYDLLVVQRVEDVTRQVSSVVQPKMSWGQRFEAIRLRKNQLETQCEAGESGEDQGEGNRICEVEALDGGASYIKSVYQRVRDVRLVYAPPKDLGKFGGDVDNWMFPRHTADFTFLRAYVDSQGQGAPFSAQNVPLATPLHLEISPYGVHKGSLVEVIGFPGRTSRHVTSHAVRFYQETQVPKTVQMLEALVQALGHQMEADPDVQRKYASLEAALQNGLKYYRMSQKGLQTWDVLSAKLAEEAALQKELSLDPPARKKLKRLLTRIEGIFSRQQQNYTRLTTLRRVTGWVCPSVRVAYDIVKWSQEKAKPDAMRKESRYKEKNIYRVRETAQRLDQEIALPAEKALLLTFLKAGLDTRGSEKKLRSAQKLLRWSKGQLTRLRAQARRQKQPLDHVFRQTFGTELRDDPLAAAVDMVYGASKLVAHGDNKAEQQRAQDYREKLLLMSAKEVAAQDDPLLLLAAHLEAELRALKEGPEKEVEQHWKALLHPRWVSEFKKPSYPDANFTVRLTLGSVRDYRASATGKTHAYLTTLQGLLDKDQGAYPFRVPQPLKDAAATRQKSPWVDPVVQDIPVNFTATLDTTGGNSGSPVLDDRGRLVGLLFDGTPEGILSDWQFLPEEQRSICLDIRFALYLATVDKADGLLEELGVAP